MLIYGSQVLNQLQNGQPVPPNASAQQQVGPGFASASIINESPWRFDFVNANSGAYPVTPWATATVPVSPGDSWYLNPVSALVTGNNYIIPPGVSTLQVVVAYSTQPSTYSIRELFTVSSTMLPDDFTFGTATSPFEFVFSGVDQTQDILTMTPGSTYSLLYVIFSINNLGGTAFNLQGVDSSGGAHMLATFWTGQPLQGIIVPMFLVSTPGSANNILQWICSAYQQNVQINGSLIYRTGAPSNVTPWLT